MKNLESQLQKKWIEPQLLKKKVQSLRDENKTIATINGSFDLMHAGHLRIIYEASIQADILIVALNSDSSIQKYKSKNRPIINLEHRFEMVSSLFFVDYVTSFDETDPIQILSIIKPDVHINGKEYGKNCIEADIVKENGGKIHIVDLVGELSTTNIIKKIKLCE